jgi:hypothetical protein
MFMMMIDNCWWLVMMIIWLWICLNEEYMYMHIWFDYMMIDYGEGYYLVIIIITCILNWVEINELSYDITYMV